ncbi:MAG: DUF3035 domain-containing protein [Alphaproteobacteria bacterium]|nr:DUF3035 domain-containing protein [Alphaproteobacteria bacterium]
MKSEKLLIVCVSLIALTGCGEVREAVGLVNTPPDEFAVIDHPPLSMPPDFDLRPPRPGAAPRNAINPSTAAAKALYGEGKMETVPQQGVTSLNMQALSPSEQALISQTGSDKADPRVRSKLDKEASQQVIGNRRLLEAITFWKNPKKDEQGVTVDAAAEKERLEKAKRDGVPITATGTPAIEKSNSVLIK